MKRFSTSNTYVLISLCILAIYLALTVGTALTEIPITDEGFFANPAFNLLTKGRFATTILETFATPFKGMDRHTRSEEHTSELQSLAYLVCRLLLEKKKKKQRNINLIYTQN